MLVVCSQARTFLAAMPPKPPVPLEQKFPNADKGALALLQKLIAFDPADRPSAAEALKDPYFAGLPSTTQVHRPLTASPCWLLNNIVIGCCPASACL